jgi:hypothetical protein
VKDGPNLTISPLNFSINYVSEKECPRIHKE